MKRIIALIIAIALFIFGISASIMNQVISTDFENMFLQQDRDRIPTSVYEAGNPMNTIAIINVEGTILDTGSEVSPFGNPSYNHQMTLDALKKIKDDNNVKAVILNVDTPGGGVYESEELYRALMEVKDSGKTIYSSMAKIAASGGYYISAPADKIYASRDTMTGSIGVISSVFNVSELLDNLGIEEKSYTSGDMKSMLSPTSEASEEEEEYMMYITEVMFDFFIEAIVNGRGMDEDELRDLADGRIYLGVDAVENGLVDELGYFEDALEDLKAEVGENAHVVEYGKSQLGFFGLPGVKSVTEMIVGNNDALKIQAVKELQKSPRPMYLHQESGGF